jgi:hypothetical protein
MFKQKLKTPTSVKRASLLAMLVIVMVASFVAAFSRPDKAEAATNSTINFQARLLTAAGKVVPDGTYNVEFKLYDVASSGTALWTETRTSTDRVRTVNGYLTVNLGSITGFGTNINWDQELWLTMNIGGTAGSPSWDGEMSPRLKLTSVPYAFRAGQLVGGTGANTTILDTGTPSGNNLIHLPAESGTLCVQNSTNCGFATSAGSGNYIQNGTSLQTANFYIQSAAANSVGGIIRGASSQTSSLFQLLDGSSGLTVAQFTNNGYLHLGSDSISRTGQVVFHDGTLSNTFVATLIAPTALTANRTITLPNETGTLCIQSSTSCGFAAGSGDADYIQNQNASAQTTSSFYISGVGRSDTALEAPILRTNNGTTNRHVIDGSTSGNVTFNANGAATDFTIQGDTDVSLFVADGSADRIGIGVATPGYKLDVNGDINVASGSVYRIGGSPICTVSGCVSAPASGSYIQNGTTVQTNANFNIRSNAIGSVTGVVQGANGQTADIFQAQTWNGTTATTVLAVAANGTVTASAGLVATGTVNINASSNNNTNINTGTSTGTVTIGGGSAPLAIDSTNFDVSTAGAVSGVTTLTTSGAINGQTISSAANFTGTLAVQGNTTIGDSVANDTLTVNATLQGSTPLVFEGTTADGNETTFAITDPTTDRTVTFGDEGGTVCLQNSVNCGFALSTGSGNYIQNGTTVQTANYAIRSAAIGSIAAVVQGANGQTADILRVQTWNGTTATSVVTVSNVGLLTASAGINVTSGVTATGTISLNASSNNNTNINTGTSTGTVTIGGGSSPLAIDSTNFDVSTAGAVSGVTTITTSGAINGQTISSAANFTGTLAVQGNTTIGDSVTNDTLTLNATLQGATPLVFEGTTADGNETTFAIVDPTTDRTVTFGDEAGTVCLQNSVNCGFALSSGSGNYIQNGTTVQVANYAIRSAAIGDISAVIQGANGQTADILRVQTWNGTTATSVVTVSNAGLLTASSGITVTNGLTATGTVSINASNNTNTSINTGTSTGTVTIGGGSSPLAIDSTNFDVTTAGAVSGVTTLTTSGAINGQTISATANFTGTLAVQGNTTIGDSVANDTLTVNATLQGGTPLVFEGTTADANETTFAFTDPTADRTVTFGDEAGTVCLQNSVNCGFAASTGSGNYIQNGTTIQTANYAIRSSAIGNIGAVIQGANGQTADLFRIQTWNGTTATSVVTVSNVGLLTASAGITVTNGLTASGTIAINSSVNSNTDINTGTSTGTVTIGGGTAPLSINSTNFDVSTAGAVSGVTTLTTSGAINGQTISSAANFTGTVTIQGSTALTLGTSSSATGSIVLRGSGGAGTLTVAGPTTPNVGNFTVTIPAVSANANFCTDNSVCTGYAPASGSGNYIQNGTAVQTANFAIRSSAIGNVGAVIQGANGQTADILRVQTWNGTTATTVFGVGNTGNITATGTYNSNTFTSSALTFGAAATATISSAASQALDITSNAAATWSTSTGNLSIQAQGNLNLGNAGGQNINIGTDNKAHTITIGNQSATGAQSIIIGSNGNTGSSVSLESGASGTINIGNAATAHSINIGAGAAAQTIAIGSTNGASSLSLSSGTGDLNLTSTDLLIAKATTSFQVQNSSNAALLYVDTANGRVGVGGQSTFSKFEVIGGDAAVYNSGNNPRLVLGDSTAGGQNGYLQWDSTNDYFRIESVGTNGLKINDNFIAIGNMFPDQPLKVANGSTLLHQISTTGTSYFKTSTNNAAGFQIQDSSNNGIFTVDTSAAEIEFGKASTTDGKLAFYNSSNANIVNIQSGVTSSAYTLTLPTALGNAGDCLKDAGSGALQFTACGNLSGSLQGAYTSSIGGTTPEIIVDSSRGGVDIQDVSTPGSSLGTNPLFAVRGQATASTLGAKYFSIQGDGRVAIGNITATNALDVAGSINVTTGNTYKINGTDICSAAGCTAASGSGFYIQNGTAQQTANFNIVSNAAGSTAAQIQNAASSTVPVLIVKGGATPGANADLIQLQDSSSAVHMKVDNDGDAAISKSLKVGTTASMASSTLDVAGNAAFTVNNTATNTQTVLIEQTGTGDSAIELKNTSLSYYMGIDTSAGTFKLSSSQASGSTVNMGYTTQGGTTDAADRNTMNATKFTAGATGTVSALNVYVASPISGNPNDKGQVAIYSDNAGVPNSRLGFSNDATLAGNTWNTINLTSGVSVTSGQVYWLVYNTNGSTNSNNNMVYDSGAANQTRWVAQTYGTWPTSWSGGSFSSVQFSIYAPIAVSGASDNLGAGLMEISGTGATKFKNSTNSTSAFQIQNAGGTAFFNADSTNQRIGIGTSTPAYMLDVAGDINISTGSSYRINGTAICTSSGCTPASGSTNYIQNQSAIQQASSSFWVSGTGRIDGGLTANSVTSSSGNLTLQGTSGTVTLGSSSTLTATSTLTIQSGTNNSMTVNANGTGALNLGSNATSSRVINIGATGSQANTSTTNIGTSTGAAQTINIGATNGASTTTLNGGTGGINLLTNSASASVVIRSNTNATNAFQIQNASSSAIFSVNTSTRTVTIAGDLVQAGVQPATVAGTGTNGSSSSIAGAAGGNTSGTTGQTAGSGGSLYLDGGAGGTAPSGSANGWGGNVFIAGGAPGAGAGSGGFRGNVILQGSAGSVGIGTFSPSGSYKLDVAGDINISSGSSYRINGTAVCSGTTCTPASGSANYIQNQNSIQQASSTFWISGTGRVDGGVLANNVTSNSGALILQAATNVISLGGSDTLTANGGFSILSGTNSSLNVRASGTGSLGLGANGSNRIVVTSAGNTTITSGSTGVALVVNNSTSTGNILNLQSNGTNTLTVNNNGDVVIDGVADSANALNIIDGSGVTMLNFNTNDGSMKINGNGTNGGNGRLYFGDQTWVYIGEYTNTDSDAMQLIGENGIYFGGGAAVDTLNLIDTTLTMNGDGVFTGTVAIGGNAATEALSVTGNFNVRNSGTLTKQYRFRTTGSALDFEGAGADMYFSVWSGAGFTGTQYQHIILDSASQTMWFPNLASTTSSTYRVVCINPSGEDVKMGATNTTCQSSSARYKQDIQTMTADMGIETIMALRPVTYYYKDGNPRQQVGFIAEEMDSVLPELVVYDDEGRPNAINYEYLVANLTKGIQQQQSQINQIRVDMNELRQGIWNGGLVTNDTTFNNLVTFNSGVKFTSDATFEGNVAFKKKVTYSEDAAGTVTIPKGETEIEVKFKAPYANVPRIALSADQFVTMKVTGKTVDGFKINLRVPYTEDVVVDWVATQTEVVASTP